MRPLPTGVALTDSTITLGSYFMRARSTANASREQVSAAAREAETVGAPGLETIFSDVYAELPRHLRQQGERLFDLAARRGDAQAGEGKFPL